MELYDREMATLEREVGRLLDGRRGLPRRAGAARVGPVLGARASTILRRPLVRCGRGSVAGRQPHPSSASSRSGSRLTAASSSANHHDYAVTGPGEAASHLVRTAASRRAARPAEMTQHSCPLDPRASAANAPTHTIAVPNGFGMAAEPSHDLLEVTSRGG